MEFKKLLISPRTPQGFRLATFAEVTNNFSMLRTRDILDGKEILRLLDSICCNGKEISIGESWRRIEMLVVGPTRISRSSSLLRDKLYSGISLDNERRKTALRLSCLFEDIEVICWLLSENENRPELKDYFEKNIENEKTTYFPDFLKIVKTLLESVQIGEDEVAASLDYALNVNGGPDNAIAIAEIVLDKCRKVGSLQTIVDSQIQRVAKMSVDTNAEANRIGILTKLLSECADRSKPQEKVIRPIIPKLLREADFRGYVDLAEALLRLQDTNYELEKDEVDKSGENWLHYAARAGCGYKIMDLLREDLSRCKSFIHKMNKDGLTPLHVAAMYDNRELLEWVDLWLPRSLKEALKATDCAGRTPLHLAASHGVEETVKLFLKYGSDLFHRDIGGKTAVHHAVGNRNGKDIAQKIVVALLGHLESNERKALLLWISAPGIGTADQAEGLDLDLQKILKENKSEKVNILEEAAKSSDSKLTWELLNRGGDISSIKDDSAFRFVTKAIEKFSGQGTDQPTLADTLGRNVLAECISSHFLNPYIKSPITVSISGGSGSGKSSLMHQIEAYLLITAAQLAFPYFWDNEKFNGAKKIFLSSKGERMCQKIEKGVYNLLEKGKYRDFKDDVEPLLHQKRPRMSLVYLLKTYLQKYKGVYKALACMDFNQLMEGEENNSVYESQGQSLGAVPRILTVNFNAGHYRGRTEAWAGLAVEITKEIEGSMTWAQLWSTRLRNTWNRHREDFYLQFIFPCVLLAFVGPWIGWAAWKLIDLAPPEFKNLQYGSVPATVIAILWPILCQVVSVFKPISTQMSGYFSLPDHSQKLGYQQKVISDIKFLKEEIGKKPCFIFYFIAGEMCKNWWGLWKENVEDTCIPQYGSAPEGKLRIIAFVDDLDQCEEKVILQVLWAINLVFRVCEINVILTMDKATIQTAYHKSSLARDRDFVDKFISKIVQLPVNIPDPADDEWVNFLNTELLREPNLRRQSTNEEYPQAPDRIKELLRNVLSEIDGVGNRGELEQAGGRQDIESRQSTIKFEGWCITFLYDWLIPKRKGIASRFLAFIHGILYFLSFVVCNIRDGTERHQPEYNDDFPLHYIWKLIDRAQQVRDTLMLSYTDEEAKALHQLKSYATGIQKLPREWKCYINYHKFARNVVSKMRKGKEMPYPVGWEVEFVVWTFVCSQWKHEMNVLIDDWYKYADAKDSNGKAKLKSSLKEIVQDYNKQLKSGKQAGKKVPGIKKKERERWENLQKCLENVHDVSLEGIHCFQDFRFHCDARNLISQLYKPEKLS